MAIEMGFELGLRQTQRLVMTPKLQQALRLLQMPMAQLEETIREELESNPVLEVSADGGTDQDSADSAPEVAGEETPAPETPPEEEVDWSALLDDDRPSTAWERETPSNDEWEPPIVSRTGLSEHLLGQLRLDSLSPDDIAIGEYIVGSLDDDGLLRSITVDEIATNLGVDREQVEKVRSHIRQLDPVGVGSVDLREALLSQLEAAGEVDSLAYRIVESHLDDLLHKRFPRLVAALGCSMEDVQAASDRISHLDPRIGARYSGEDPRFVTPDLVVDEVDGEYVVSLNETHLPRLRISPLYQEILTGGGDEDVKAYVGGRLNAARWLIRTIDQRRRTMIKVMRYIVEVQREFFRYGDTHLRPLTLQEVADGVGMHESTISRVTSGKYVQTPRGVFELKYFFGGGLRNRDGEEVSVKTVKRIIRDLVSREDPANPLSDERIADELRSKGFGIARRTVSKYREQMSILPARLRQHKTA
ncbi:RNA polymerase factor sigma-54 [Candidatus Fermentibacteria bacterium]|nr:RNA polymerase factor sigma-54 [Candidatus Fermentibacteria bacterium]